MDGKEWQEPMTKSQKKKAEKEAKKKAAEAAGGGNQVSDGEGWTELYPFHI